MEIREGGDTGQPTSLSHPDSATAHAFMVLSEKVATQLAAQAEALRWKRTGRGYAIQAGFGAAAAVFALMLVAMLHLAAFNWL